MSKRVLLLLRRFLFRIHVYLPAYLMYTITYISVRITSLNRPHKVRVWRDSLTLITVRAVYRVALRRHVACCRDAEVLRLS